MTATASTGYKLKTVMYYVGESTQAVVIEKNQQNQYIFTMPANDVSVGAEFEEEIFTVTYYDTNNFDVFHVEEVLYQGNAVYAQVPQKQADERYTYTFDHWSLENGEPADLTSITNNISVYPVFSTSEVSYTVIFKDEDGTILLQKSDYHYGDIVVEPTTPTKANTVEHTYEFANWDSEITLVYGDKIYKAVYTEDVRKYTILFNKGVSVVNEDGISLHSGNRIDYGSQVTISYTLQDHYHFVSLKMNNVDIENNAVIEIGGDTEIILTQEIDTCTIRYFTEYIDEDHPSTLLYTDVVDWGTASTYVGENPEKAATAEYTYEFIGWAGSDGYIANVNRNNVTQNLDVYAVYYAQRVSSN